MKQNGLKAAWTAFNQASESLRLLGTAQHPAEVEWHWSSFLSAAHRVFNKLAAATKGHSKDEPWFRKQVALRRDEPVLRYVHHARNAEDHGIQSVTDYHPGGVRQVTPTAEDIAALKKATANEKRLFAPLALLEWTPSHVKLVDVIDSGVTYPAPTICRGQQIGNTSPHSIGLLALSFIEPILKEADTRVQG